MKERQRDKWNHYELMLSTGIVVVLLILPVIVYFRELEHKEQSPHTCDLTGTMVSTPFNGTPEVTVNNGGWRVVAVSICEPPKWDLMLHITHSYGLPIYNYSLAPHSANLTGTTIMYSKEYQVRVYTSGEAYFGRNGVRTGLDATSVNGISERELESLENVSLVVLVDTEHLDRMHAGTCFLVFKDNDCDGKDEVVAGNEVTVINKGALLAGAYLG